MHLSFITSNVLHQVLEEETNIVYNPIGNIFDKILFSIGENFFVFGDYASQSDNCISYSNEYIDLRNYDLYIHSDIPTVTNNNLGMTLHANTIVFEHKPRPNNLKKEDIAIINQRTSKIKKIFFNEIYQNTWGLVNSTNISYGIPEVFKCDILYDDRKDVLILGNNNLQAANQLKTHLESKQLNCSIYNDQELNLQQINKKINNYKIFINLDDDYLLNLIAAQCGCSVLKMSNYPVDIPNNFKYTEIAKLVNDIPKFLEQKNDLTSIQQYIEENHNFNLFKIKISDIIQSSAKREAFIL
tara:strand:- start:22572 stop:23468 length:897 start_codon:yes stop_codon:yes gene_type:complete